MEAYQIFEISGAKKAMGEIQLEGKENINNRKSEALRAFASRNTLCGTIIKNENDEYEFRASNGKIFTAEKNFWIS